MTVLRIGSYLMETKGEGIIVKTNDPEMELWCDTVLWELEGRYGLPRLDHG